LTKSACHQIALAAGDYIVRNERLAAADRRDDRLDALSASMGAERLVSQALAAISPMMALANSTRASALGNEPVRATF
jgi:hypothetical protein